MKRRIYLHIGRHKSGTSTVQYFFTNNREALRKKGYCYPKFGTNGKIAHHLFALNLNPKFNPRIDVEKYRRAFLDAVKNEENIIISSEAFQNISDLNRLVEFFKDFDLYVICYFREVLEYFISAYAQKIHANDYYSSFDDYIKESHIDYKLLSQKWSGIAKKFYSRLFKKEALIKNDIVMDILSILNIDKSLLNYQNNDQNISIGGNLLLFKKKLNELGLHDSKLYYKLGDIAKQEKRFQRKLNLPEEMCLEIRNRYKESNDYLIQNFGYFKFTNFSNKQKDMDNVTIHDDFIYFLNSDELINFKEHFGNNKKLNQYIEGLVV